MPFPKVEDVEKLRVNGRKPTDLVKPVKGEVSPDRLRELIEAAARRRAES